MVSTLLWWLAWEVVTELTVKTPDRRCVRGQGKGMSRVTSGYLAVLERQMVVESQPVTLRVAQVDAATETA